jgi:hypothetical protein
LPDRWIGATPRLRALALAAGMLAIALLGSFYAVVAGAVHRGQAGRDLARVALERQAICSAFSATPSRDLCLLTISARAARDGAVIHAFYERPARSERGAALASGL